MKLNEIFFNFFNRVFNRRKTEEGKLFPENSEEQKAMSEVQMTNSLTHITGEQLLEKRKEQYRAAYTSYITNLLLQKNVNPILAENPKISSVINDKIGLFKAQINNLKKEIDLYNEYPISELQNTFKLNEDEISTIEKYIANLSIEKDGNLIEISSNVQDTFEEYEVFNQGIMCTKRYFEKDENNGKNHNISIKEVINPKGKYIARRTIVTEDGYTANLDIFTKKTVIDEFKGESYAKEGIGIKQISNNGESKLENFGKSDKSIDPNMPYTKEQAHKQVKQLCFNKVCEEQNDTDINSGFIYRIKRTLERNSEQTEVKNPQKFYITDEAKKYFETRDSFENKAAQLLEERGIDRGI